MAFVPALMTSAYALDIVPSNSNYYYQIGGGSSIEMPPVTNNNSIAITGPSADLNYSCNGFNPMVSISNSINNIKSSVQGMASSVISSATAAVGSLPMYLLSKSNKDLYDLLQNTMSLGREQFDLSVKSCQQALSEIKQGKSPYQDWFSVSDSQGWLQYAKQAEQGQGIDINDAKTQLAKDPAKYGVPWVHKGQNSGGSVGNQQAIHVVKDVVTAGYNVIVDPTRALDDQTAAPTTSPLAQYWATPEDAAKWAQLVVGGITITSNPDIPQNTHGGIGLSTLMLTCPTTASSVDTCVKTLQEKLTKIVQANRPPTGDDLSQVSSGQMIITPKLIQAIRNQDPQQQALSISQLAQNVAVQNTINEAFLLREILEVASNIQVIHSMKPALENIKDAIHRLDSSIQGIQRQIELKRELLGNTASVIMQNQYQHQAEAQSNRQSNQKPLNINGAIYKQN